MPEVKPSEVESTASIKVIGVGGAGGSAVNRMRDAGLSGVEFVAMNTDAQALHNSKADVKVHLGQDTLVPIQALARRPPMRAVKKLRTRSLVQIWPSLLWAQVAVPVLVLATLWLRKPASKTF